MATLVLSTVGTILGGPVGGAIGSLLGQSIDQQLLGPGPREGPRLGDLSVQTSSYGSAIPKLFGTMRVAGTIIWSTDLQESRQTQGAKGQPETITYSYSASFAVALSSRPIRGVRRIWADGKLIRNAAAEFTVSTGFRTHSGGEDQEPDPLIASIEGAGLAPAYRGLALAVFENLQLADFGNRIPFLTFEVEADEGAVPIGTILEEASCGAIVVSMPSAVTGYAAHGSTIAASVEPLVEIFGVPMFDDGTVLASPATTTVVAEEDDLGCSSESERHARIERSHSPAANLPAQLSVNYYDPARDYQSAIAAAALDDRITGEERIELPAVLAAGAAKALAETTLARRWAGRETVSLRLPPAKMALRTGSLVDFPGASGTWIAERVTVEGMTVAAVLRPVHSQVATVPADPGRVLPSLGVEPEPTTVEVAELPDSGSGTSESQVVAVAASSSGTTWKAVPIEVEAASRPLPAVSAGSKAVIGTALAALGPGQAAILDRANSLEVELIGDDQWLESRDDVVASELSNLALIGDELVQFESAIPAGPRRFRLSGFLRGRRGTEWAMGIHGPGERFLLVEPSRLVRLPLSAGHSGAKVAATPRGLADSGAPATELIVTGEAMRPLSPAHLRAELDSNGTLRCSWVRRSRLGWAWLDGVDATLDCGAELYRIALAGASARVEIESGEPEAEFAGATVASLGAGPIEIKVVQVGDFAVSRPAALTLNQG